MNPGGAGDLTITVGGDLSQLETAFEAIPGIAQEAFGKVQSAIQAIDWSDVTQGADQVAASMATLSESAMAAEPPIAALNEQLELFADIPLTALPEVGEQLNLLATYAGSATGELEGMSAAAAQAGGSLGGLAASENSATESLANLALQAGTALIAFQLVKTSVEALAGAYGDLQKAQLSLGAILGNPAQADAAIDSVKQLANALGLAQDAAVSAQQKLAAMGIALADIPGDLTAIADGAAAMNTSFDTAAQRFDQIINSGTLMARSLTSIGLNVNDVAQAMGVAGVPAATLSAAFKDLDEQQRAAVLSSAELAKNAGLAATAASGVAGAWNQVKNAFETALQEMGKQVDGFSGLASAATTSIRVIEQLFVALVGDIKLVTDSLILLEQQFTTVFSGIGTLIGDALTGNFKAIPGDVKTVLDQIQSNTEYFLGTAKKDWSDAADGISSTWSDGMKAVVTTTQAVLTPMQAAQSKAQELATQFKAVAAGFANGSITASQYTAALTELNAKQDEANNGFQNAGTALLLVENDYRMAGVAAANALTDLTATVAAVDAGQASWTQYDAALKTLDADQRAVNGGLEDSATALALVGAAYNDAAVAVANAQTHLAAVVGDMAEGDANAVEYTAALNALQAAWIKVNGGVMDFNTAVLQAADGLKTTAAAAQNATIALEAQLTVYQQTGQGLVQLIDLTNKWADAQAKANNGIVTYSDALAQITGAQSSANIALQNAQTQLAAANQLYADGTITLGTYQKYLDAAKTAQDAMNGTTKTAATATQSLTTAQNAFTSSLKGATDTMQTAGTVGNDFATSLQYINGQWINLGGESVNATKAVSDFASSLQYINGQFVNIGSASAAATTATSDFASSLSMVNGQFVQLGQSGPAAATAINGVSSAAKTAAGSVQTLGAELDKLMGDLPGASLGQSLDASMNAKIGDLSVSLQQGQTYQQFNPSTYISEGDLGNSIPPVPGQNPFNTTTQIYGGAPLTGAGNYGTPTDSSTTSATATAATTVSDAMIQAIQQAMDANAQEQAASAAVGTAAYDQLKASADAAVAAAGAAIDAAQGQTAATVAQTAATTAAASSTATLASVVSSASDTITAAATGVAAATDIVNKIVAPLLGPGQGVGGDANLTQLVNTNVPVIGSQPGAGAGNGTNAPTAFATNLIVNLNAGTVVGNNGMQQLSTMVSNEMVNQLSRMGIRLNRQ